MEEKHTVTIVSQVLKNIQLAKNIDNGAIEQKSAIEGVNRAIDDLNRDMSEMVRGVQEIYESARLINADTKNLLDKTLEGENA
jgi:methyl-accepting chemotaxis protein